MKDGSFPGIRPNVFAIDSLGNRWVNENLSLEESGLRRYSDTKSWMYKTSNSDLPDGNIEDIQADRNGMVWIGTRGGLALLDATLLEWGIISSINEYELDAPRMIHSITPQPTSDNATLLIYATQPQQCTVTLHAVTGEHVATLYRGQIDAGRNTIALSTAQQIPGHYLLRVSTASMIEARRFMIVR